jgi:hypothetical protein
MDTMTDLYRYADTRYARTLAESERARFRAGLIQSLIKGLIIGYSVYVGIGVLASL